MDLRGVRIPPGAPRSVGRDMAGTCEVIGDTDGIEALKCGTVSTEELERCALADFDLGGALVTAARRAASSRPEPPPHPLTPGPPAR